MRNAKWLIILTLLLMAGCSPGDDDSESEHLIIRTLPAATGETLTLTGGSAVTFPAATFIEEEIVIVSDLFSGSDATPTYYPTPLKQAEDLLGALVVNTPADALLHNNLPVAFELRDFSTQTSTSAVPGVSPGDQFAVYRYDPDNRIWNRWGATTATVDATGDYATATLPTNELLGFIGSVGLFKPNDVNSLPVAATTVIAGTVVDGGGVGVQTDVSLYVLVGANKYPRALDDPDAFVPNIPNPEEPSLNILVANAVMSEPDGTFSFEVPDGMVGQLINLSFGLADPAYAGTDNFDVQTQAIIDREPVSGNDYLDVEAMRIQYGVNTVRSRAVD